MFGKLESNRQVSGLSGVEGALGRILFDNKPGDSFTKHLEKKGGRYIIRYRDIPTVDHTKFQPEQKAQRGKGETKREKKKEKKEWVFCWRRRGVLDD